jgi:hypothetical protein
MGNRGGERAGASSRFRACWASERRADGVALCYVLFLRAGRTSQRVDGISRCLFLFD